ncbi:MAG: sulfatase-like hydrolase/transferase [Candidatus Delongbacteria bacterium]
MMIFKIIKNTLPSLFIVWSLFITGFFLSDKPEEFETVYFLQHLKVFFGYTLLGFVIGGLSAGILAKKKKKYAYFFENEVKKYSIYFIKCFFIAVLIFFVLISRELINNPLLYKETLLNESFWFSSLFVFVKDKFSPMYFTVFFGVIIIMSIHNMSLNLSIYQGAKRITGYFAAILLSAVFIFNFGYLNAEEGSEQKNIILIAVQNLKHHHFSRRHLKDKEAILTLKQNAYIFENFYSVINDPKPALVSALTSLHPEKEGYSGGYASYGLGQKTVFSRLEKKGYNIGYFTNSELAVRHLGPKKNSFVKFPAKSLQVRSRVLLFHILSPVLFANKFIMPAFKEALILDEYRDNSYFSGVTDEIIENRSSPFILFKAIPDHSDLFPYPYYRLTGSESKTEINLKILDDEIGKITAALKKNRRMDNTVICVFGLPERTAGLKAADYKVPVMLSYPGFEIERKVKNHYSLLDIVPTVLDAADVKYNKEDMAGVSFFAPEFVMQNIILTDISVLRTREDLYFFNKEKIPSKNLNLEKEIYPLISRSLIRGDYKLDITPTSEGPVYKMYDLSKDAAETDDISGANPVTLRRMRNIYEEKMNKDFNFRIINGHALK